MSRSMDLKMSEDDTLEVVFTIEGQVTSVNLGIPTEGLLEALIQATQQVQTIVTWREQRSIH